MNETIKWLNETVWCTLAPSPTHGIGVFALRDIPKGQTMYCNWEPRRDQKVEAWAGILPEIQTLIEQRWPNAYKGQYFISPNQDQILLSFMNHSPDPNYSKYDDCALRDIKAGEEVFEDYRPDVFPSW